MGADVNDYFSRELFFIFPIPSQLPQARAALLSEGESRCVPHYYMVVEGNLEEFKSLHEILGHREVLWGW